MATALPEPALDTNALLDLLQPDLERLMLRLAEKGLGLRRLHVLLDRAEAEPFAAGVGTAAATRDAAHLARLLAPRLEDLAAPHGVEGWRLLAARVEPMPPNARGDLLGDRGTSSVPLPAIVDRLRVLRGVRSVHRVGARESRVPERSAVRRPVLAGIASWPPGLGPRPPLLLRRPAPVEALALVPDGPPEVFAWSGMRHRVLFADGPERVWGEWWRASRETHALRDYYAVETEGGRRFWLFRDAPMEAGARWFVHGLW